MDLRFSTIGLIGTCVLLAAPTDIRAQAATSQPGDMQRRNDCRLAAQVLRMGEPHPRRAWALGVIRNCAEEGPAVVAGLWADPALDSAEVERLVPASRVLRDGRLAAAVLAAARSPARPEVVRLWAMSVAVTHADESIELPLAVLVPPPGWKPGQSIRMILGGHTADALPPTPGEVPLPPGFEDTMIQAFHALASDPNPRIAYVAAALAKRLEAR